MHRREENLGAAAVALTNDELGEIEAALPPRATATHRRSSA
jgi:hypothetical protein